MQSWSDITDDVARNWPVYASMPFVAALIGYVTKIVAIRMMFRPHTFTGIGPIGWQGIIPRRAPQMVDVLCETLTGRLISADEIISRVDADELGTAVERRLRAEVARIVPVVADAYQPALWRMLPNAGRDLVVQRAQVLARGLVPDIVTALRENIDELFDLQELVTREFLTDPDVLESMFLDVGRREFAFIRRSGLVFGFGIGLVQAVVWALFRNPLVMPIFGLFTGWFTDWVALRLIFNPKEPTTYLGVVTWQGLFLKHRIPVSQEYGSLIAENVLTVDRLVRAVFRGPNVDRLTEVIAGLVEQAILAEIPSVQRFLRSGLGLDKLGAGPVSAGSAVGVVSGMVGGLVGSTVGRPFRGLATGFDMGTVEPMSRAVAQDLVAVFPEILEPAEPLLTRDLAIRSTMIEKMSAMTPLEFEGVLRPAFHADEKTLIMVGAILGFLVGELQVFIVEHLSR